MCGFVVYLIFCWIIYGNGLWKEVVVVFEYKEYNFEEIWWKVWF